jgi:bacillopeptidase F
MKRKAVSLAVALLLGLPMQVQSAGIAPELESMLQAVAPEQEIGVIVRFSGRPNLDALPAGDQAARRSAIITALRKQAEHSQKPMLEFLRDTPARQVVSLWMINGMSLRLPAHAASQLVHVPLVQSISLDATLSASETAAASSAPAEWNLSLIGAPQLWQNGHLGQGVVVASLDTGVDIDHADLAGKWRGGANSWFDPHGQHDVPGDIHGHGTQTMGLIVGGDAGGTSIGVAPGAQWIAAKIFDDSGIATYSAIHQAYQWVLDPDGNADVDDAPQVVSNAWGMAQSPGVCDTEFRDDISVLRIAGIAMAFSAGNAGPAAATSVSPANYAQSLSVGAVDSGLVVANFSSRGPSACDGALFPTVVAPGVDVRTTDLTFGGLIPNAYIDVTGTSFAVAHVAGGMALLISAVPDVSVTGLETALRGSANDIGATGADNDAGHGVIDLATAFQQLSQVAPPQTGALQFTSENYSVTENGAQVNIVVERVNGSDGTVSVDYAATDGSASSGSDYLATSGTLTFGEGETGKNVVVTILDDMLVEGDETVLLTLSQPGGGAQLGWPTQAVLTIVDDDEESIPPANQPPLALDDAAQVKQKSSVRIAVLANDSDSDGNLDPASVTVVVPPANSRNKLTINADGSVTFKPASGFRGTEQFQYTVQDDAGAVSNAATVLVEVVR